MAIYQYYLAVVPLKGIKIKHDSIPFSIGVSSKTGYFETDAEIYWQEVQEQPDELVNKIDKLIKRANWGNDKTSFEWKIEKKHCDNDVSIYLDEKKLTIREFSFRADLREKNLMFLMNMIELGKEFDWIFMDRSGKLIPPNFNKVRESIKESKAYRFLKDPIEYLDSLEKKKPTYNNGSCCTTPKGLNKTSNIQ